METFGNLQEEVTAKLLNKIWEVLKVNYNTTLALSKLFLFVIKYDILIFVLE